MDFHQFPLWDPAEHLNTAEEVVAYLEALLEENDAPFLSRALQDIGRSKGMSAVSKETGITFEELCSVFCVQQNPQLAPLLNILNALKLKVVHVPAEVEEQLASTGS